MPDMAGKLSMDQMRHEPERLIVVAVANPSASVATHAGSTLRGYDGAPSYAASGKARAIVAALAADYQLSQVAAWPIAPLELHCVVFRIPERTSRDALLDKLARDPRVRLSQPLQTFGTLDSGYNDPYVGLQRGFATIDAAGAQQWSRGDGISVAVIDTGIDITHPDLKGRVALQRNFVDDDEAQFNRDRHGTEVAGIIAAIANNHEGIVGVAPGVHILALKACWQAQAPDNGARCNSFTLALALTAAFDAGARVINLSLGGPADPLLAQLVEYGLKHGAIVIAAVPPEGRLDGFPLATTGVIAVDIADQVAVNHAVLHAPGRDILTLTPGGHYDFASGSSLAAAHVTGTVALLLSSGVSLDAAAARELLSRTSSANAESINACAALAALKNNGGCATATTPSGPPLAAHAAQQR